MFQWEIKQPYSQRKRSSTWRATAKLQKMQLRWIMSFNQLGEVIWKSKLWQMGSIVESVF